MSASSLRTALITGASSGIGATYADRLARRGHDLVLVARDRHEWTPRRTPAQQTGVAIDVLPADLTCRRPRARRGCVCAGTRASALLVNNAGATISGGFSAPDLDAVQRLINLNVVAVARLAGAVVPRFLAEGGGAIINLASVLALAPEVFPGIYPATKAFVLTLSQSLQAELGPRGVYVQAVLPGATRTEIWPRAGRDVNAIRA